MLTSIFTGVLAPIVVERYRERRKTKEIQRSQQIQQAKTTIEGLKSKSSSVRFHLVEAIDRDLENVNHIKFFDENTSRKGDILNTAAEFSDFSPLARRYVEAIEEAAGWRDAIRKLMKPLIADLVASDFPETAKLTTVLKWDGWGTLDAAFEATLIDPIIRGDKLNRELLDQLCPELSTQIDKEAVKGEGIPKFLKSLNEMVVRENSLKRFRAWQEKIRTLGKELKEAASNKLASLQGEQQQWEAYLAGFQ
jgi:hypothetical protein